MGKIHDALQRAEEERAKNGAAPGGVSSQVAAGLPPPRPRAAVIERSKRMRDMRRSRVMIGDADSRAAEQYRTLRARIQHIRKARSLRSIIVTSALAGEGKTTTAINLALSFGLEREGRTCLVDADLRTPAIHHGFFEEPVLGLAELLDGDQKLEDALVPIPDTQLSVLSVKALPTRPSELLASRRMADLLRELQSRFDTVIIDSPPVLGLPDATILMDLSDAVLLVVASGAADRDDVEAVLERIDSAKAIGCVFNRSSEPPKSYYGYGGRSR
jgi:capsular exopolysaccharide synthesis family protein